MAIVKWLPVVLLALCLSGRAPARPAAAVKVLLCTGDYGMWAQDRAALIEGAMEKAAPGEAVFESEQAFNFVKKLEAPGYAERFDVVVCGDLALGQMMTRAQAALVRFVNEGGGLIYDLDGKSGIAFTGPRAAEPLPLAAILPYQYPSDAPLKNPRPDAAALGVDAPLFKGLDFAHSPLPVGTTTFALSRPQGKGQVLALAGAFGASYKYVSYAKYEKTSGSWDQWPGLGEVWSRLLENAAAGRLIRAKTRAQVDAAISNRPVRFQAVVDATREIDDVRAANFSIGALEQLYKEDGGANEDLFLALNPRDWLDRGSQDVLPVTAGKAYPDKVKLFSDYQIQGILQADNSFGSYGGWDEKTWQVQTAKSVAAAKKYPQLLTYFQPGNEPPCDAKYFEFHNRLSQAVLQQAPNLKVLGPNTAFNVRGPDEQSMKAFIAQCGATTDVLNWHIYGCPPENVRDEVSYWTKYAQGKMRSPGPVQAMFTEADSWNTEDSQFNYLMDRAFTFLPTKQIRACFQYCMEPRTEGGTYKFGVLQPEGEYSANYNGYWIFRNLRGRLVSSTVSGAAGEAQSHCHVLASRLDGGKSITVVVYYDTGYFDGTARADKAAFSVRVTLPSGRYRLQRGEADWKTRTVSELPQAVQKTGMAEGTLLSCHAAAFTWTRQETQASLPNSTPKGDGHD